MKSREFRSDHEEPVDGAFHETNGNRRRLIRVQPQIGWKEE